MRYSNPLAVTFPIPIPNIAIGATNQSGDITPDLNPIISKLHIDYVTVSASMFVGAGGTFLNSLDAQVRLFVNSPIANQDDFFLQPDHVSTDATETKEMSMMSSGLDLLLPIDREINVAHLMLPQFRVVVVCHAAAAAIITPGCFLNIYGSYEKTV
jgi:hypothetical protein